MRALLAVAAALVCPIVSFPASGAVAARRSEAPSSGAVTEGQLRAVDASGHLRPPCPLEHTGVDVDVTGFVARVTVTQRFRNPFDEAIEAVYLFPLSADAAVDRTAMRIGDRTITGRVARRSEALAAYETARAEGRAASLLEQERPNVFTQSVANIPSGAAIDVTISYVETLACEAGRVSFVFPMVVGSRYVPAASGGAARSMARVARAARSGMRAGHGVSIDVRIDAGVPLDAIVSKLHAIDTERTSERAATVRLAARDEIPNRDFVLSWDVAGRTLEDAALAHRDARGGFVTFILQPPDRTAPEDLTPKEVVFVVDTSGSMSGLPMEKAKEVVRYAVERLGPDDTFNLVTFSGSTQVLFPEPVPASPSHRARAMKLLAGTQGSGGTEMMTAIRAALDPSDAQHHVRIVCFLTDGYVGNDLEILGEIRKHPSARIFAIGIGNAVNRFLLDEMAASGRGEADYALLTDDGESIASRFFERIRNPLLTDVSIDWNGLPVTDVLPERVPDVFSARPVVVAARYDRAASGTIRIRGYAAGREVVRDVRVDLPEATSGTDAIATLWARRKVTAVSREDYEGLMNGSPRDAIDERVTALGLEFGILTPFTSFVAVDDRPVTGGGDPRVVPVPAETPGGTDAVEEFAVDGTGSGAGHGSGSGLGAGSGYVVSAGETLESGSGPGVATRSPLILAPLSGAVASPDSPSGATGETVTVVSGESAPTATYGAAPEICGGDDAGGGTLDVVAIGGAGGSDTETAGGAASADVAVPKSSPPVMAPGATPAAAWARSPDQPAVEIVFAIDTTGSMEGLLDGARRRIWSIVNAIQRTECQPRIRIGLVAYRDRGDEYETMVLPLTTDLDLVWMTINGLTAAGGGDTPESVDRALSDALSRMGWSPEVPGLSQVVFLVGDAPPQSYAGDPDALVTAADASARGIVVHAIQCGSAADTRTVWTAIAQRGSGAYFPIPPDETVAASVRTPYDRALADLGRRIGDTYTPYGSVEAQEAAAARQAEFERTAAGRGARAIAADRAVNKAVNSGAYAGDFLQAIENGEVALDDVPAAALPVDLRGLSRNALRAEIGRRLAERSRLRAAILDLAQVRDAYRERRTRDAGTPAAKFDTAVADAVREQMRRKGGACR